MRWVMGCVGLVSILHSLRMFAPLPSWMSAVSSNWPRWTVIQYRTSHKSLQPTLFMFSLQWHLPSDSLWQLRAKGRNWFIRVTLVTTVSLLRIGTCVFYVRSRLVVNRSAQIIVKEGDIGAANCFQGCKWGAWIGEIQGRWCCRHHIMELWLHLM